MAFDDLLEGKKDYEKARSYFGCIFMIILIIMIILVSFLSNKLTI